MNQPLSVLAALLALSSISVTGQTPDVPRAVPVPDSPPAPLLPKAPEPIEPLLRLQIFLDKQLFGPGKLDGRPGDITNKALQRFQRAQGLPETTWETHTLDLSSVPQVYTTYTIREEDLKFVGDCPTRPSLQSKKKFLPYSSLLEFLGERFHSAPEFLEYINRPTKMSTLKPGDTVQVPTVEPFLLEELEPIPSLPEVPEFATRTIHIDTREKILELLDGDKLLASLPITPGSGHLGTPPGTWKILGIACMPTFRWDESVLNYGVRSGDYYELPIGPNNPVGVMWIGLNRPGIGIHGTNTPDTIGRASSHGCMRTANWDVVRLAKMITKGMTVVIEGPPPDPRPVLARNDPEPPPPPKPERRGLFNWLFRK